VCVKTRNWFSLQLWKDDLNSYKNDQETTGQKEGGSVERGTRIQGLARDQVALKTTIQAYLIQSTVSNESATVCNQMNS